MLANFKGLGSAVADMSVTYTTGMEVIDKLIAAETARIAPPPETLVPVSKCPWYLKPEIGEKDLECQFPSNAVLLLGAAGIGVLVFLSVRRD